MYISPLPEIDAVCLFGLSTFYYIHKPRLFPCAVHTVLCDEQCTCMRIETKARQYIIHTKKSVLEKRTLKLAWMGLEPATTRSQDLSSLPN